MNDHEAVVTSKLPRVAITYCTQCKWMLRAAWMGQELLSTFGTSIGEIALIPATGGIFTVRLHYMAGATDGQSTSQAAEVLIWDRKRDGGFPEAKILKQLIRNHIEPDKNLGHSDTPSSKAKQSQSIEKPADEANQASAGGSLQVENKSAVEEAPCADCK